MNDAPVYEEIDPYSDEAMGLLSKETEKKAEAEHDATAEATEIEKATQGQDETNE